MPKVIRDRGVGPKVLNGYGEYVYQVTSSGGGTCTIETQLARILTATAYNYTDNSSTAVTVASSSTYLGKQKVSFTMAAGKVYMVVVKGTDGYDDTSTLSVSGALTIDDQEIY